MASLIPIDFVPNEMLIAMRSRQYPDLADALKEICFSPELTPIEVQEKIRQTVQLYEVRVHSGVIKPGEKHS